MSAKFHENPCLIRYFCNLVTLLTKSEMLLAHCTSHVSDTNDSHSLNSYPNCINQERYTYISTIFYTLVILIEPDHLCIIRNGGVFSRKSSLERAPSIASVMKFLSYITLQYDRLACQVPYEVSQRTPKLQAVAIIVFVSKIGMRSARWLLCHNEWKHWRFCYSIDVL
jgi:hypothetical protein